MKKLCLLSLLMLALGAAAGMKPLSMDAIDWDVRSVVQWQYENNEACNSAAAGYIVSTDTVAPWAADYTFEMTLKMTAKPSKVAGESGIVLIAPEDRYAIKLLMRDANKNARTAYLSITGKGVDNEKSRIKCVSGKDFRWDYKKAYVLRISLKAGKVTAAVIGNGKELAVFTGVYPSSDPVRPAFTAGHILTRFGKPAAEFSDPVEVKTAPVELRKPVYTAYNNVSRKFKSEATGFFYTKQDDKGYWWLIDPAGNAMFACGADGIGWVGRTCEALGYSEYHRNIRKYFDSEKEWVKHTKKRLNSWGFNYAGTCCQEFCTEIPFANNLMIGSSFAAYGDAYNICPYEGKVGTALPNPFHPRFAEYARKRFMKLVGRDIENPYFLGYYCDNELRWLGMTRAADGSGVFDAVLAKPASHTARIVLMKFLKERYNSDIAKFNAVWKSSFSSFDEVEKLRTLKHSNASQLEVKLDYLTLVAEAYFKTLRDTLKAADPNHLFLGCRYAGVYSAHDRIWIANGKYCDVVSFNIYPSVDFAWNEQYLDGVRVKDACDRIYNMCKRPMMITEWAFLAFDSGLPCTKGAGARLETQDERARAAGMFYRMMLNHKGMVGVSWYEYGDDPALGVRRRHPENSNYGLVNKLDQPYEKLVNTFRSINRDVDAARTSLLKPRDPAKKGALYREFERRKPECSSVRIKQDKNSFSVNNGEVTIYKTAKEDSIFIRYKERTFSRIMTTIRSANVTPREWTPILKIKSFKIVRLGNGVEISLAGAGKSKFAQVKMYYRIFVPAKGSYVITDITGIKNESRKPLKISGLYIQPIPVKSFVPLMPEISYTIGYNLHRQVDAWVTSKYDYIGCANTLGRFHVNFYKHDSEGLKSDAYAPVCGTADPNVTWKPETPAYAFIIAGRGAYRKHAQKIIDADMK